MGEDEYGMQRVEEARYQALMHTVGKIETELTQLENQLIGMGTARSSYQVSDALEVLKGAIADATINRNKGGS